MAQVYLPTVWVLAVVTDASYVCFHLQAVLVEGHPLFYWPPAAGEQHPYAVALVLARRGLVERRPEP
jgi:hypothetical protein